VKDTIYLSCTITYTVTNDPENVEIITPAFGVFHLDQKARAGEPAMEEFQVYIDIGPVFARVGEVEKLNGK
jgi:hypothetical protein